MDLVVLARSFYSSAAHVFKDGDRHYLKSKSFDAISEAGLLLGEGKALLGRMMDAVHLHNPRITNP